MIGMMGMMDTMNKRMNGQVEHCRMMVCMMVRMSMWMERMSMS